LSLERIRHDMMFLAGQLMHRSAQTQEERRAAEYLLARFKEYTKDAEIDDFFSIDNFSYLFASYYGEFLVVALFAFWWPLMAGLYGMGILIAYLAEFLGFTVFSRFMPHYETQNVMARFLAPKPEYTFIITAYYDSGCASPLTEPERVRWIRPIHHLVLFCMVIVTASCFTEALGVFTETTQPFALYARWASVLFLVSAAAVLFLASAQTDDIRGANNNASGTAALLHLAERFAGQPLQTADVWLVAAGSHEAWMSGIHRLLKTGRLDREHTYILNLEAVGAGTLHYLTGEGLLHLMPSSKVMVAAAEKVCVNYEVTPAVLRHVPSAMHIPLAHGYKAMSIMGLDKNRFPVHWNCVNDLVTAVEEPMIERAAMFAESALRQLHADLQNTVYS